MSTDTRKLASNLALHSMNNFLDKLKDNPPKARTDTGPSPSQPHGAESEAIPRNPEAKPTQGEMCDWQSCGMGDCHDQHKCCWPTDCFIAAGQPFVEESAGPVATRSGWFCRGRLQGLREARESVRSAWAKHAGKSFDQKFPNTTHECPKCKGFVESLEAVTALSSKPDKQ